MFVLLCLAGERLIFPAVFFFILLFPCGPRRNSSKSGLWKSEDQLSRKRRTATGLQPFIRRKSECVNCTVCSATLLDRGDVLQVDHLEVAANNPVADHLGRPAFFRLPVGVQGFLHAGTAIGPMSAFKATAQAAMSMSTVAITVARHLVNHGGGPGRGFIGFLLRRSNQPLLGELLFGKDRRQLGGRDGARRMKSRNFAAPGKLSMRHN